ncbi:hypothetical protein HF086_008177, partial [Spodoptera exigua]
INLRIAQFTAHSACIMMSGRVVRRQPWNNEHPRDCTLIRVSSFPSSGSSKMSFLTFLSHYSVFALLSNKVSCKSKSRPFPPDFMFGASTSAFQVEGGWREDGKWGLYAHPIFSKAGDYPKEVKKNIAYKSAEQSFPRSRLPELTPAEVALVRGSADFLGVNAFTTKLAYRDASLEGMYPVPSFLDDMGAVLVKDPSWTQSESSWLQEVPWGFNKLFNEIKSLYDNPPVEKFGLYEVDFSSSQKTRTPRKSAFIYKEMIKSKILNPDFEPEKFIVEVSRDVPEKENGNNDVL